MKLFLWDMLAAAGLPLASYRRPSRTGVADKSQVRLRKRHFFPWLSTVGAVLVAAGCSTDRDPTRAQVAPSGASPNRSQQADASKDRFVNRVVVKFVDNIGLPYQEHAERELIRRKIVDWESLRKLVPEATLRPLLSARSPERIRELVDKAKATDREYAAPDLFSYFVIDCPSVETAHQVAAKVNSWKNVVVMAYVARVVDDPVDTNGPEFANQHYLEPRDLGINAHYAWTVPGGAGQGIKFIDLEAGWTRDHEDFPPIPAPLIGIPRDDGRAHGTQVLGAICAVDNKRGIVGIAHKVNSVQLVAHERDQSKIPDCILTAIDNLSFGDVLLLEAQVGGKAVELRLDAFSMIRLATALGIVVVEAVGNSNYSIDPEILGDSGAIIVTGATQAVPHQPRKNTSNVRLHGYGNRVDCYAWGEGVQTCNSLEILDPNNQVIGYTKTDYTATGFSATSAGAAIIAGAALSVQGMANAQGFRFSPAQLRAILRDPNHGIQSADPVNDLIGVMPDLEAISQKVINSAPDVFIRDFVGDIGNPHTGAISASPDIILRDGLVANAQVAFGPTTANNNTLGFEATAGQDNFIYVRLLNRGNSAALDVTATVYWAPPATLVTPNLWKLVGSVTTPPGMAIQPGTLTVLSPIKWEASDIPAPGHYCFVGLIGNSADPAPLLADFKDFNRYQTFIRNNNNVAWRNFNVVNNTATELVNKEKFIRLRFLAPGPPDEDRPMQLAIMPKLPKGSRLFLAGPDEFMKMLGFNTISMTDGTKGAELDLRNRWVSGELLFRADSRTELSLLVQIPDEYLSKEFDVYVSQLYRSSEVGRVSWRLAPPRKRP